MTNIGQIQNANTNNNVFRPHETQFKNESSSSSKMATSEKLVNPILNGKCNNSVTPNKCEYCDFTTSRTHDMYRHKMTAKYKRCKNSTDGLLKSCNDVTTMYHCQHCNFTTKNAKNYETHNLTEKHKQLSTTQQDNEIKKNICDNCNKEYAHASSLCKHKKICSGNYINVEPTVIREVKPLQVEPSQYKCKNCHK
jgi:hypothetical protein